MTQDSEIVRRFYDEAAAAYAARYSTEMTRKPMDREAIGRFVEALPAGAAVVDLGCGPGEIAGHLHRLGVSVCGIDLSPELLAEARRLHPDVEFRTGDLLALDLEPRSIDAAIAFYAIVHFDLPAVVRVFSEIHRVLRPGGAFLFTYHVGDEVLRVDEMLGVRGPIEFVFHPTPEITRALAEAGFSRIEVREREPYPDVEYPSRRAYVSAIRPRRDPAKT